MNYTNALEALPALGETDATRGDLPAVYLFTPDANATWVLWEYDPTDRLAFGFCDLGLGFGELGYVSIDEVATVRGAFGLPVEWDRTLDTRFKGYRNAGEPVPDYLKETTDA